MSKLICQLFPFCLSCDMSKNYEYIRDYNSLKCASGFANFLIYQY